MNILFLLRFFPYFGGGESVTVRLANEFTKRNHNVFVMYLKHNDAPFEIQLERGVKEYAIDNDLDYSKVSALSDDCFECYLNTLSDVIKKEKIDIVINQWWPSKMVYKANNKKAHIIKCHHSAILVDSKRKEVITKVFGDKIYKKVLYMFLRKKYLDNLKYSDEFIVLGESLISDLEILYGSRFKGKVRCIPNPSKYNEVNLNKITKEKSAVYVGRFSKEKRIEIIVNVWADLYEKGVCKDWELYLVGDGETYNSISSLVEERNCKNITLLGTRDPIEVYQKSQILLLTSAYEGFPMVIVEAMQNLCVPVVMNTFSNCAEMICDGNDGILVENDISDFSAKLSELLQNESRITDLARNAVISSKRYRIDNVANMWDSLFLEVINDGNE